VRCIFAVLTGRLTAADHARVLGRTAEYTEAVRKVWPGAALFLLHAHGLVWARAQAARVGRSVLVFRMRPPLRLLGIDRRRAL
jgi:hypothetical protein